VVGDWMGSLYTTGGRRWGLFLFLDHDGRYERTVCVEPDYEKRDAGRWEYDESERVLRLISDTPDEADRRSGGGRCWGSADVRTPTACWFSVRLSWLAATYPCYCRASIATDGDTAPAGSKGTPNQALQKTGHANSGSARHGGFSRMSRLLSFVVNRRKDDRPPP
jgi:hypothetical protein